MTGCCAATLQAKACLEKVEGEPRGRPLSPTTHLCVEVHDRLTERSIDAAPQQKPVVEASQPRSRLVLDHDAVPEPSLGRYEVSLVMRSGHPALGALVFDEQVLLEAA